MPLIDPFGRTITYLRVSVTDRCNLRCRYCMPPDVEFMDKEHLLTFEEIERIVRVAAGEGVRKVRLTGGEPLTRRDFPELARRIGSIDGITEFALSTNGVFFADQAAELREAGIQRVNISLDTLRPETFKQMTGFDRWDRVMAGIRAAIAAGLHPVKVNCVLMGGVNDDEVVDFVEWARREPVHVRFIEYMPVGTFDAWQRKVVIPRVRVEELLNSHADLEPIERDRAVAGPADEWRIRDGAGSVGIISAVTNEFCEACNRIRLTSDGKLRGCLISNGEVDMREPLRDGISDAGLRELLLLCIRQKPEKHLINDEANLAMPSYQMHQLGG